MSEERFTNAAALPQRLHRLHELAIDLWWSWDPRRRQVFRSSITRSGGPRRTTRCGCCADRPARAPAAADRRSSACDAAIFGLTRADPAHPWSGRAPADLGDAYVAYFSAEFALHQSLPIYAGGSACSRRRSLQGSGRPRRAVSIGVGFMYPAGLLPPAHFERWLAAGRTLRAASSGLTRRSKPRSRATASPAWSAVPLGDRTVWQRCGASASGACRLLLLDTDLAENAPWDRELSARLYGGDRETRIQQEIILGIGGVRACARWASSPPSRTSTRACSVRRPAAHPGARRGGPSFDQCAGRSHAAGRVHDTYPSSRGARRVSVPARRKAPGRRLGRDSGSIASASSRSAGYDSGNGPQFNMTALALRTAAHVNGGQRAARRSDASRCGGRCGRTAVRTALPVTAITNGVHVPTWMRRSDARRCSTVISGPAGSIITTIQPFWERLDDIPDEDIWQRARPCVRVCSSSFASGSRLALAAERVGPGPHRVAAARCWIPTR